MIVLFSHLPKAASQGRLRVELEHRRHTHLHQSQVVGILWRRRGERRQGGGGRNREGGGRKREGGGQRGRKREREERVECQTGYIHVGHNNYGRKVRDVYVHVGQNCIERELTTHNTRKYSKLPDHPSPAGSSGGHRVQRAESSQPLQMSGRALMVERRIYTR